MATRYKIIHAGKKLSDLSATTSAELAGVISDETGSGALVFANTPTLVTPLLGTPTSGILTNCTGLPTAGLLDNAVTLAKMAGGTDGNLITYDANGDPAYVATGNSGQVLTSNGVGTAPTFQAAAGGGGTTTIYIPASAMHPSTTNGAAVELVEYVTNDVDMYHLAFDTTTQEFGQFTIQLPSTWDAGTITAKFHWTNAAGLTTETVRLGLQGYCYTDSDAIDVAWGTGQIVDDTWLAQNDVHITAATPAITIGGTVATGKPIQFRVYRVPASDNLTGDCRLAGIEITFTNS